MFGLLLSGRLVDTSFRAIDDSHVVIDIERVDSAHHIVVFLTGERPFPDGMGGAVYFSWPQQTQTAWQFLGHLTNTKPSAIFKIVQPKQYLVDSNQQCDLVARFGEHRLQQHAQLGISMEPLSQLSGMAADASTEASTLPSFIEFAQKMVESLFNFSSSFEVTARDVMSRPDETYVPFSTLRLWYSNFERRLLQNPNFWRS